MQPVMIGERPVGDGHPCFVLAEAGCNHNQRLDLALQLVDVAAAARADAVKFQTYTADELYSKHTPMMEHFREKMGAGADATMYDLIARTELPYALQPRIVEHCREVGIPFLSTPFGLGDVDLLERAGVPAYKIASFEMTHFPLLRRVAETGRPVILSTGMSSLGDIEKALEALGGSERVILLHCVSNYPTDAADCNLRVIETLKRTFGCPVGFSDHTPGNEVTRVALAVGANLVEKHFTVDQTLPGPDHHFSLTPTQLRELVEARDAIEAMLGSPFKTCTAAEQPMKRIGRRSLCAARAIRRGERVRADMIAVKRPGTGIPTELADVVIGARAVRDVGEDEPLSWDMFVRYEPAEPPAARPVDDRAEARP